MNSFERLEAKLDKIIELLTPKETKIQVVTATDAPNGFSIDIDGSVEINDGKVDMLPIGKITLGQHTRKRMIKAAQDAHRILASNVFPGTDGIVYMYRVMKDNQRTRTCTAEFIVVKEKRKIICLLKDLETRKVVARGISKCDPQDTFNVDIGSAIALYRALGLNVPSNYLNVPQPTNFEVGQIVYWTPELKFLITKDRGNSRYDFRRLKDGKDCKNHYAGTSELPGVTIEEDGVEV